MNTITLLNVVYVVNMTTFLENVPRLPEEKGQKLQQIKDNNGIYKEKKEIN